MVQFGDDRVGRLIAFMLDCLHLLGSYTQIPRILQDTVMNRLLHEKEMRLKKCAAGGKQVRYRSC